MAAPTPGPTRTCVGCRRRAPAAELLRLVAVAGVLVADPRHRRPGRGVYLHLAETQQRAEGQQGDVRVAASCLPRERQRGKLARALRVDQSLDCSVLDDLH